MESIKELLKKALVILKDCNTSTTPILDAEVLLVHILNQSVGGFDRLKLLTHSEQPVAKAAAEEYIKLVYERSKGKPVQYITQCQEFMGLMLHVEEGVLIPRADTEIVVEKILELARDKGDLKIIDMCTGSGAIGISLASFIPGARIWAVDISETAIRCCEENIRLHGLGNQVYAFRGDLFEGVSQEELEGTTDIIVSNPPYIASSVIPELDINVQGYEPHLALDGGEDGLVYYRRIVQASAAFLKAGGILAFEIGHDQGDRVKNIMEESGYYVDIYVEKDLAGFDRCIWSYRK